MVCQIGSDVAINEKTTRNKRREYIELSAKIHLIGIYKFFFLKIFENPSIFLKLYVIVIKAAKNLLHKNALRLCSKCLTFSTSFNKTITDKLVN